MHSSRVRYVVASAVAISTLTSCGGTSPASATLAGLQRGSSQAVRYSSSCPCLYVANHVGVGNGGILVYPEDATKHTKPLQDISGSNTELNQPRDVAVDSSGRIYVVSGSAASGDSAVLVFASGATGNVAPIETISGSNTALDTPGGISLDPVNGDIYVANSGNSSITIYAPGSNGNVGPLGAIQGASTGLDEPTGLVLDTSGNIYVPNYGTPAIYMYAAGSVGNVAPTKTIAGSRTELTKVDQLALDSNQNVYAINATEVPNILEFTAGSNGNVKPTRYIDSKPPLYEPDGIALDQTGNIYVSNLLRGWEIYEFSPGARGKRVPPSNIIDERRYLSSPAGLAIR